MSKTVEFKKNGARPRVTGGPAEKAGKECSRRASELARACRVAESVLAEAGTAPCGEYRLTEEGVAAILKGARPGYLEFVSSGQPEYHALFEMAENGKGAVSASCMVLRVLPDGRVETADQARGTWRHVDSIEKTFRELQEGGPAGDLIRLLCGLAGCMPYKLSRKAVGQIASRNAETLSLYAAVRGFASLERAPRAPGEKDVRLAVAPKDPSLEGAFVVHDGECFVLEQDMGSRVARIAGLESREEAEAALRLLWDRYPREGRTVRFPLSGASFVQAAEPFDRYTVVGCGELTGEEAANLEKAKSVLAELGGTGGDREPAKTR